MATAEKIRLAEEELAQHEAKFPNEPDWSEPDVRDTPVGVAWEWQEILRARIEQLGSVPWTYPVVRVTVRTEEQRRRDCR